MCGCGRTVDTWLSLEMGSRVCFADRNSNAGEPIKSVTEELKPRCSRVRALAGSAKCEEDAACFPGFSLETWARPALGSFEFLKIKGKFEVKMSHETVI